MRTETRERNRAALLAAAAELAREHGYAGTSLAAVAARAGLSTGAVYSIFGSKVELFIEVLLPDWHVPSGDELPRHTEDVPTFLEAYARHWAATLRRGDARKAFELAFELYLGALREPALLAKARSIFTASQEQLTCHIERVAAGAALAVPAPELARTVVAALQGLSQLAVALDEEPDEELFARVARRLATPAAVAAGPS